MSVQLRRHQLLLPNLLGLRQRKGHFQLCEFTGLPDVY